MPTNAGTHLDVYQVVTALVKGLNLLENSDADRKAAQLSQARLSKHATTAQYPDDCKV